MYYSKLTVRQEWKELYRRIRVAIANCDEVGGFVAGRYIYNRGDVIYMRKRGTFHGRSCNIEVEIG